MKQQIPQNNKRVLLRNDLPKRVPYTLPHIYRLMKQGEFPKQIRFGKNRVGWLESEIDAWLQDKLAKRNA